MFTKDIKQWIFSLKDEELILAKVAYEKHFSDMKEATFYQLLARLNEEKYIGKIAKGLYYKPNKEDFNALPSTQKLINFFTNKEKNGMIVGGKMLEAYGIIPQAMNVYDIYTNVIEIKTRRYISNLVIENVDVDFKNIYIRKTIEILELIEIIDAYGNVNIDVLREFLRDFSTYYKEEILFKVLMSKSYKKRNIAALKVILDYHNVPNNLSRQLNTASKYSFPVNIVKALDLNF